MPPHIRPHMIPPQQNQRVSQYEIDSSPVSPMSSDSSPQGPPQNQYLPSVLRPQASYASPPPLQPFQQQQPYPYNPPHPQQQQQNFSYAQPPAPQPAPPKAAPLDLLTSPLDVTLPSQDPANQPALHAPPIPPNPEKDALLTELSQTLHVQLTTTLANNASAASSLRAQNAALASAIHRLQSELSQLDALDAAVETNERILRDTMRDADRVMEDAKGRKRPEVDEVLVAPTVVGNQLYRECGEIEGLREARQVVGRGVDGGVVGVGEFVRQTRSLAREEFLKKVVVGKIARGLGLEDIK